MQRASFKNDFPTLIFSGILDLSLSFPELQTIGPPIRSSPVQGYASIKIATPVNVLLSGNRLATIAFEDHDLTMPARRDYVSAELPPRRKCFRALHKRLQSSAYRTGFMEGLGAPELFIRPRFYRHTYSVDASIGATWKKVGDALKSAAETKDRDIEQAKFRETECAE